MIFIQQIQEGEGVIFNLISFFVEKTHQAQIIIKCSVFLLCPKICLEGDFNKSIILTRF